MSKKEYPAKLTTGYYRVREVWEDEASQLGAYRLLANAKAKCDENPGSRVFDNDGNVIYPEEAVLVTGAEEEEEPPQPASRAQLRATAAVDKIIFARIFMGYSFFYGLSLPQGQTIVSLPYRPRKCKGADRTFAESSPEYFVQSAHQAAMDCRAAI